ncbi:MAG TPA: zinc ABC transporter substrate-binding protein [Porphyromonadaceae bacterium]|nr:zinc ABC transporter substrate-binding protein [Porphyromonadaceae bacterium]
MSFMDRNSFKNIMLLGIVFLSLLGCVRSSKEGKRRIMVSIPPQQEWVKELVRDRFEVDCMIPKGVSPENYDPTTKDLLRLSSSCAYICMGELGFERVWIGRLFKQNTEMKLFYSSQGIDWIDSPSHSEGGKDPHIWTSPKQLSIIMRNTTSFLIQLDSTNADEYRKRLEIILGRIQKLDTMVSQKTMNLTSKSFAIYHPSLTYFARDYGLKQIVLEKEGKEPSALHILNIGEEMKRDSVKVFFIQQEFDDKNAELLCKECHCKIVRINPLNGDWEKEISTICNALQ